LIMSASDPNRSCEAESGAPAENQLLWYSRGCEPG
jgi:hypothetical protein